LVGKGNEDKRGQPIGTSVGSRTWLYVNGRPVVCDRHMEVAALVSSMNPSLSVTSDAKEVAELQKELLWLLYDHGYLDRYPMALGKDKRLNFSEMVFKLLSTSPNIVIKFDR